MMNGKRFLGLAAFLIGDAIVAMAAMGPCNITVPGGVAGAITCTGSVSGGAYGCAGSIVITVQQSQCGNTNSTPCTDAPNNLQVIRPALLVPTTGVGPCYGWGTNSLGIPVLYSHDCTQGAPIAIPGGNQC